MGLSVRDLGFFVVRFVVGCGVVGDGMVMVMYVYVVVGMDMWLLFVGEFLGCSN